MKRLSFIAAAALLFAGAQLHAQSTKQQDTTKKAHPTATKKSSKKTAEKHATPADTSKAKKSTKKKSAKKDTTTKKP